MWSPEQLQQLFTSPMWTGRRSHGRFHPGKHIIRNWEFWLPLIGAFSMMRLEEIAQLCVSDLHQQDGIWVFHVATVNPRAEARRSGTKQQQLKNTPSKRLVPVHKTLLDIGILELIENRAGEERLFPELRPGGPDARMGTYPSKRFTDYRQRIGCYWPLVDFHSFRHTGTTLLVNAGVQEAWIDELTGHESEKRRTETSRYTKGVWLPNLKTAIDTIDLGVDFSHLYRGRGNPALDPIPSRVRLSTPSVPARNAVVARGRSS
jgi:integrase